MINDNNDKFKNIIINNKLLQNRFERNKTNDNTPNLLVNIE